MKKHINVQLFPKLDVVLAEGLNKVKRFLRNKRLYCESLVICSSMLQ